jgi:hypothetical protein
MSGVLEMFWSFLEFSRVLGLFPVNQISTLRFYPFFKALRCGFEKFVLKVLNTSFIFKILKKSSFLN